MSDANERMTDAKLRSYIDDFDPDDWEWYDDLDHKDRLALAKENERSLRDMATDLLKSRTDLAAMTERVERAEHQRNQSNAAVVLAQDIIKQHEAKHDTLRSQLTLAEQQRDAAVGELNDLVGTIRGGRVGHAPHKIYTVQIGSDWLDKMTARIRELGEREGK